MLYNEYKNKLSKRLDVFKKIWRFRILIFGILAFIVATTFALLFASGTVYGESVSSELTYGTPVDFKANAFLGNVITQYRSVGKDEWSDEIPYSVGEYEARAVAKNAFGSLRYGKTVAFKITKLKTKLIVPGDDLPYAETPTLSANLAYSDTVKSAEFIYDYTGETECNISVDVSSVRIEGRVGDVTNCYEFSVQPTKVKILRRAVTIKTCDAEKVYDGEELDLPDDKMQILSGSIADGEELIAVFPTLVDAGEVQNLPEFTVTKDGVDVTKYYDINWVCGTLSVLPREINIRTFGAQKVYDGEQISSHNYEFDEADLLPGHRLKLINYTKATDAAIYDNVLTFAVLDGETDVTRNYKFNLSKSSIIVDKRVINVKTASKTWGHDGERHSFGSYEVTGGMGLISGHELTLTGITAVSEIGDHANVLKFAVKDKDGNDYTKNYDIVCENGVLRINKEIIIRVHTLKKEYDGKPLVYGANDFDIAQKPDGVNVTFSLSGGLYDGDAGVYPLEKLGELPIKITDGNGNDVSEENYVLFDGEPLEILKRKITVTSISVTAKYNGKSLTAREWWISFGSLLEDQYISVNVTGSISNVGKARNTIESVMVYKRNDTYDDYTDVTHNYVITYDHGTLELIR